MLFTLGYIKYHLTPGQYSTHQISLAWETNSSNTALTRHFIVYFLTIPINTATSKVHTDLDQRIESNFVFMREDIKCSRSVFWEVKAHKHRQPWTAFKFPITSLFVSPIPSFSAYVGYDKKTNLEKIRKYIPQSVLEFPYFFHVDASVKSAPTFESEQSIE